MSAGPTPLAAPPQPIDSDRAAAADQHEPVNVARAVRWQSAGHWALALFDQAVVSGSRFLISIIVGRAAGPEDLGRYAVAFYILVLLGCVQEALLTTPFAICAPRLRRRSRAALLDSTVAMHGLFIVVVASLGLAVVGSLWWFAAAPATLNMAVAIAVAAPLSLVWEFTRRMMLAQLRIGSAALIDSVAAALQIAGLIALAGLASLDGATALAMVGLGCALPALICLWRLLPRESPRQLGLHWKRHWRLGKWLMGSQIMRALSSVVPVWLLAALSGEPAAGVFAACVSIPMISNPFIFAVGNLLMPKAAQAYNREGVNGLVRLIVTAVAVTSAVLLPLGLLLVVAGDWILELVYGSRYQGQGLTLAVLGFCPVVWASTSVIACGQAALQQTRASFTATVSGILVSTVVIAALATSWDVLGAAIGLLAGSSVMGILQGWQFWQCSRELARAGIRAGGNE